LNYKNSEKIEDVFVFVERRTT